MECFICGIKSEKTTLFSAIVREGIVLICENCSAKERIPIVKRVSGLQLKESEKNQTVYERLSAMAGLNPEKHKAKTRKDWKIEPEKPEQEKPGQELRRLVEKNNSLSFPNLKQTQVQSQEDLIRNYHWTIFNARRAIKLTQKQLAESVGEPEASIKLIERGILPKNYEPFIKKLEICLGVTLFNKPLKKDFNLDNINPKEVSIEEINKIKEKESKVPYWKRSGFLNRNRENKKEKEFSSEEASSGKEERSEQNYEEEKKERALNEMNELTQEEMDKITFSKEED